MSRYESTWKYVLLLGLVVLCTQRGPTPAIADSSLDFEDDLQCVPNTMTSAVGVANAQKINDALGNIGIGDGNGPSLIGDTHGKFWAVAAKINSTIAGAADTTFQVSGSNVQALTITTSQPHGLVTNDKVGIRNVGGVANANGVFHVRVLSSTTFALYKPTGGTVLSNGGTYSGGGEWWNCRIIRIPERSGGTLFGTGKHLWRWIDTDANHVVDGGIHEGRKIGATTFVNTSDPSIIDTTSVIGYFGFGWNIGPFCINGAYARTTEDADELFGENQMAAIGFENTMRGDGGVTGKVILDLSYVNCISAYRATEQPLYIGHGDNVEFLMFLTRTCRIGIGIDENQAVGNNLVYGEFGTSPIVFDLAGSGGNVHVSQAVLLEGGTFLKGSGMLSNSGRFDCDYLKIDSNDPATIVDLVGSQSHSIRIKGQLGSNAISANAAANQRFIRPCGRDVDIQLDLWRLPTDEALAWCPKPYSTAAKTIFPTPDLGLDESYTPPTSDLLVYVDTTDLSTVTHDDFSVTNVSSKFGTSLEFEPFGTGNEPALLLDGTHHRPSLESINKLMVGNTTTEFDGIGDFTLAAVVRPENLNTGTGNCVILAKYDTSGGGQRQFRLEMTENYIVRGYISTNGDNVDTIVADTPLREGEPALIVWTRNSTTGEMTLTVNGISPAPETSLTGALHNSTADLTLGGGLTGSTEHSGFSGDITHIAFWKRLLTQQEFNDYKFHWRKKLGVW